MAEFFLLIYIFFSRRWSSGPWQSQLSTSKVLMGLNSITSLERKRGIFFVNYITNKVK